MPKRTTTSTRAKSDPSTQEQISAMRRGLQQALRPVAYSADGREFTYEAPISADVEVGGWVTLTTDDGRRFLGQITTEEIAFREGPEVMVGVDGAAGETAQRAGWRLRVRHTKGTGTVLAKEAASGLVPPGARDTFDEAAIEAADGALVTRYLETMSGRGARLMIGTVERCTDTPAAFMRADGFDRHTFLCGQSGSGKTYALGLILEQLILRTELTINIIDPNSDFVRMNTVRSGVAAADAKAYSDRARAVQVLRPGDVAYNKRDVLRAWFSDLAEPEQAAALRLDPLLDRGEYHELAAIGEAFDGRRYSLHDILKAAQASDEPAARQLALRIKNLKVTDWSVWAHGRERSSAESLQPGTRVAVADIGSLPSASEKAAVAAVMLGNLWRARERRRPTLIVIDEAHNVCPGEPTSALQQNATDYCINIAAEGRKFGLYLLISTQRPQKVHRNVLSQCDNLVLMRMNSRADLAELAETFSFVPASLMDEATRFRQGETLVAGKIVPAPYIARVGGRVSEEGGADVPTTWSQTRSAAKKRKR